MGIPTLDAVIDQLKIISEASEIDPDTPVGQLDIDSLDLMEWLYVVEDEYEMSVDESVFADLDENTTLRVVYERVTAAALATNGQASS